MSRRTNSAVWQEAYSRWRVAVQKDGQRRYFYSSTPGRTGQREANRKADAWLEDGIGAKVGRVEDVYKLWIEGLKQTTSASNYEPIESRWRTWVLPIIGKKRVNALTARAVKPCNHSPGISVPSANTAAKASCPPICQRMCRYPPGRV